MLTQIAPSLGARAMRLFIGCSCGARNAANWDDLAVRVASVLKYLGA